MVTWESQGDFVVTSPGDPSQDNSRSDKFLVSPNNVYLRIIMRRMKGITFSSNVVTKTLVTICDVEVTPNRLTVL